MKLPSDWVVPAASGATTLCALVALGQPLVFACIGGCAVACGTANTGNTAK